MKQESKQNTSDCNDDDDDDGDIHIMSWGLTRL
jgi:hypothetical protein